MRQPVYSHGVKRVGGPRRLTSARISQSTTAEASGGQHALSSDMLDCYSGTSRCRLLKRASTEVVQSVNWPGGRFVDGTWRRVINWTGGRSIDRPGRWTFNWSWRRPLDWTGWRIIHGSWRWPVNRSRRWHVDWARGRLIDRPRWRTIHRPLWWPFDRAGLLIWKLAPFRLTRLSKNEGSHSP